MNHTQITSTPALNKAIGLVGAIKQTLWAAVVACLVLVLSAVVAPQQAQAQNSFAELGTPYDKADFYDDGADEEYVPLVELVDEDDLVAIELDGEHVDAISLKPRALSDEMLYFLTYESDGDYGATLSRWDNYHAMGAFQFDNRYGLGEFIDACYAYNPTKYAAFKDLVGKELNVSLHNGKDFTAMGKKLNTAWTKAYKADPQEFSRLQNAYAYDSYYVPARRYLTSIGIDIDKRQDCVKGMCWGMCNLFGSYGWRWFVEQSGVNNTMTDLEFVRALGNSVVKNVAKRYPAQSIYWTGWQNRYKNEIKDCENYLMLSTIPQGGPGAMYRLFHPGNYEHLYTANWEEVRVLAAGKWHYEGIAWYAPTTSKTPVYRLYSPRLNDHHYTTDKHEVEVLTTQYGWQSEGIGWYSDDAHGVALRRLFTPKLKSGSHHYTADANEVNVLTKGSWVDEGIGWYGLKKSS